MTNRYFEVGDERLYPEASAVAIVIAVICLASLIFPEYISKLSNYICSQDRLCFASSHYKDAAILSEMGYIGHAAEFSSLRQLGPFVFLVSIVVVSAKIARTDRFGANNRKISKGKLPLAWIFLLVCVWWTYVTPDFYRAADRDFTSALRPPMGTFIYGLTLFATSVGIPVLFRLTYNLLFIGRERSG